MSEHILKHSVNSLCLTISLWMIRSRHCLPCPHQRAEPSDESTRESKVTITDNLFRDAVKLKDVVSIQLCNLKACPGGPHGPWLQG